MALTFCVLFTLFAAAITLPGGDPSGAAAAIGTGATMSAFAAFSLTGAIRRRRELLRLKRDLEGDLA